MFVVIKFVSMQCNMFYNMLDVKANEEAIRHAFSRHYGDGIITSLGVPLTAPLEIPRMICSSKNGHSQVLVSGNCMQMAVGFDEKYWDDADKCFAYLEERVDIIRKCLKRLDVAVTLVGVVTQVKSEANLPPEQELMRKYFRLKTDKPVFDVLGKVTFVEDDKYYVNIALNNMRDSKMISKDIALTLDINDRYRLNLNGQTEPVSANDAFEIILAKHKDFFREKAERLLEEGIYDD